MILIFIHELGHFLTGFVFGWKLDQIYLYPYGGCSKFQVDINCSLKEEFFVLVMGPLTQILFYLSLAPFLSESTKELVSFYHFTILFFNLLPIYPLDGGKFFFLLLQLIFPYRFSLQLTVWISYVLFFFLFLVILCIQPGLFFLLVLFFLLLSLLKEMRKVDFFYQRFLLERYLHIYNFRRKKRVIALSKMKREVEHQIFVEGKLLSEKEALRKFYQNG